MKGDCSSRQTCGLRTAETRFTDVYSYRAEQLQGPCLLRVPRCSTSFSTHTRQCACSQQGQSTALRGVVKHVYRMCCLTTALHSTSHLRRTVQDASMNSFAPLAAAWLARQTGHSGIRAGQLGARAADSEQETRAVPPSDAKSVWRHVHFRSVLHADASTDRHDTLKKWQNAIY